MKYDSATEEVKLMHIMIWELIGLNWLHRRRRAEQTKLASASSDTKEKRRQEREQTRLSRNRSPVQMKLEIKGIQPYNVETEQLKRLLR